MIILPNTQSIALADLVENTRDAFLAAMERHFTFLRPEVARALAVEWWDLQVQYLRKGTVPPLEWTAAYVESVRAAGAGIEEILAALQAVRGMFIQYCVAHATDVTPAQILEIALAVEDTFLRQIGLVYKEKERQQEAAGRRREKAMADWMDRAFVMLDSEGAIVLANSFFCGMMGVPEDRATGRSFASYCDADTAARFRQILRQKRAVGIGSFEGTLISAKGGRMASRFWTMALFDPDGLREGLAVAVTDTEGAAGSVAVKGRMFENLANTMGIGCYIIDDAYRVVSANAHAREYVQAGMQDDVAGCCQKNLDAAGQCGDCLRSRVFDNGEPYRAVVQCSLLSGETRWTEVTAIPLRGEHGTITHAAKIVRDVTEQKMLEDQILRQQRTSLASQLAITVAHQLRNPLGVIIGFAEMLANGMPAGQAPAAVDRILRNSIRCKEIVQDLLEFGRGNPREYASADLNAIIRDRVQSAYTGAAASIIEWKLCDLLPPIECAADQMAQIIMNLVDNALSTPASRITVTTGVEAGQVVVRVADDGPGIPEENRERIFEPFFTTRKDAGGIGLGLCLSRTVVQEHHGSLTLDESHSPGACFTIRLPIATKTAEEIPEEPLPPPARTGRRILIVEDETDLQFLLGMALQSEGHEVDSATTGAQAMEYFLGGHYDAVVIDMLLADELGGHDLYQYLRQANPELAEHTLFVTGDMMKYQTRRFLSESKRPYLEKPFLISDFMAKVEMLFEQRPAQ